MNNRIAGLLENVLAKKHHVFRRDFPASLNEDFARPGLPPVSRVARRLSLILQAEAPLILAGEKILFTRTIRNLPPIFTAPEWQEIKSAHFIHELGQVCNITPDYARTIQVGLEARREEALASKARCLKAQDTDPAGLLFLDAVIETIDAVENLADRYREKALALNELELAAVLDRVPRYGARTFQEALQFFRILHFTLWCEGEYHNTIGRFDKYMYPYLARDLAEGRLDQAAAFDLLEEFFISFNKDSDLYPGVQQGDNGQSLVLGGSDAQGLDNFNILSEMCLQASKELKLIDPKINLRVNRHTDIRIYELGTELTKVGLGFPQYSNDDIIIPGLLRKGYDLADASNYAMAACWETIIPGCGMDIPNIDALSFPKIIDRCLHDQLAGCASYEDFFARVKENIQAECHRMASRIKHLWMVPAPFMSVLMAGCISDARDISLGNKYNNYGFHGTGLATAADSLAAIKKYVFGEQSISAAELVKAVDEDFQNQPELLHLLRYQAPKLGNDDDFVDQIAVQLLDSFADALEGLYNERGGCFRAGTGSAMYYLWHSRDIGASPDGRRKGEALGANYSPSLFARLKGPISIINSFTKPDLTRTINGGPLTLEFHETLFRDAASNQKVASLVKSFIDLGGNQLQLNAVSREKLLAAQQDPASYKNLIVRIWGWSAYFIELDKEYQDHVISRQEY